MDIAKGSWVVCAENAWIIFWFVMTNIYDGWSWNMQLILIKNDHIRELVSGSRISMIWQDQSQREGRSHRRQSLGDYIIAIRVQFIWTDLYLFRSRTKWLRVKNIDRWSRSEIELDIVACDRCVFLKLIIQMLPGRLHKIDWANLDGKELAPDEIPSEYSQKPVGCAK